MSIVIGFSSNILTVSEDDDFVELTITKTLINYAIPTTGNITVTFWTSDNTAQGQWHTHASN